MVNPLLMAVLAVGLSSAPAAAGQTYAVPAEHFSFAVPERLVRLSAAELTDTNVAAAAEGGKPALYEAGFAPAAVPGHNGARLPLVLVRYVAGRTSFKTLADEYRADEAKAYAAAAAAHPSTAVPTTGPTTGPTTATATATDPAAPVVKVDEAAHVIASERRRPVPGGVVVKRQTLFVGRGGIAIVDWSGTPAQAEADLKPLLASVRFDAGLEHTAPDLYVVNTAEPAHQGRRTAAAVIVLGGSVLFLAVAVLFFVRARRRAVR